MSRLGWRHLFLCLVLVVLGCAVWARQGASSGPGPREAACAAIEQRGGPQHDTPDPARQTPTSGGESTEVELDADSDRVALLAAEPGIPRAASAGRVGIQRQDPVARVESKELEKPPRT